jgi:hypothetical protein
MASDLPTLSSAARANLYMYGGAFANGSFSSSIYQFSLIESSWILLWSSNLETSLVPTGRWKASLAVAENNTILLIYGGQGPNGTIYNDLWSFRLNTAPLSGGGWIQLASDIPRTESSAVYLRYQNIEYIVVAGGLSSPSTPTTPLLRAYVLSEPSIVNFNYFTLIQNIDYYY